MTNIGWNFPPTGGGRVDGYNDPGMAHFDGSPLASLARETIQNSLDARHLGMVQVSFELARIDDPDEIGQNQLAFAVKQCLDEVGEDVKAQSELTKAAEALSGDSLTFLRVRDYQTTGLHGKHWHALVKQQGASEKETRGAGGSFGIGKYAPFVVSPLRTVFYWSRFEFDGVQVEQCQGKAVLMSHRDADGEETQGTGFFGLTDGCREVRGDAIPRQIAVKEEAGKGNGTSLWIAGFEADADWQLRVASSVIENFFSAIADGHLEVTLETNGAMDDLELIGIDRSNLATWFDLLANADEEVGGEDDALEEARAFWSTMQSDEAALREHHDPDLGHCVLYIQVADGLPGKVALIRKTGMLITSDQRGAKGRAGLQKFPGMQDFAAVCRFDSEEGNELLRQMENPQHHQFEPDRLPEDLREQGRRALNRVAQWIRAEIRKLASPVVSDEVTVLSELADLLPELEPDDPFGGGNEGDGALKFEAAAATIRLKPRRRSVAPMLEDDDGEAEGDELGGDEGGAGEGANQGVEGTGFGAGDGGGEGGSGAKGGGRASDALEIHDVRVLPADDQGRECRLAFTPATSASGVGVRIEEAGDSISISRVDLKVRDPRGSLVEISDIRLDLVAGQRAEVVIAGSDRVDGRAWRLRAVRPGEASKGDL